MPMRPERFAAGCKPVSGFARLIERVKDGDERALEVLVAALKIPLRRMVEKVIGGSSLEAESIVQSASTSFWQGLIEGKFELAEPPHLIRVAGTLLKRQATRASFEESQALQYTIEGSLASTTADRALTASAGASEEDSDRGPIRRRKSGASDFDHWMFDLFATGSARILDSSAENE